MTQKRVPGPTIERLSIYLTCLRRFADEKVETVSSFDIAARAGRNPAQVRKDLSYFGEFGTPGVGYNVIHLRERLVEILGVRQGRDVLLVGAGALGTALARYQGFLEEGFRICALFDSDERKYGRKIGGLVVQPVKGLPQANRELGAEIGVIAVPAEAAQEVVDLLVKAQVRFILNFAPRPVAAPPEVVVRDVDLSQQLAVLSYYLKQSEESHR